MLKAENLTLNVDDEGGKKCLLNNISFQVEDGEMLVITGPNGGGKSTLAKTLIGIQTPDSGKIILDGQDITELDINHRANAGIGFAFQQPPRFKGMTVMKLLKLATKDELSDKECCDLLTAVGLCAKDYIYRQIDGTLSGGEMKRIEIASVLAKEHSLCIFDEPEAGIDLRIDSVDGDALLHGTGHFIAAACFSRRCVLTQSQCLSPLFFLQYLFSVFHSRQSFLITVLSITTSRNFSKVRQS